MVVAVVPIAIIPVKTITTRSKFIGIFTHGLDVVTGTDQVGRSSRRHLTGDRIKRKSSGNFRADRGARAGGIDRHLSPEAGYGGGGSNEVFRAADGRRTVWRGNGKSGRFGQLALRTNQAACLKIQTRINDDIFPGHHFVQPGQLQQRIRSQAKHRSTVFKFQVRGGIRSGSKFSAFSQNHAGFEGGP